MLGGTTSPLRTRSVLLRPVRSTDADWLYDLLVGERGSRWRYRGRTPSPAEFSADLWRGVHTQFVIEDDMGRPVGLVGIYNHNPAVSAAHLFVVSASDSGHLGTEAAGVLMSWAFSELDLDKIWIETPEFNLQQFATLTDVAEIEGRLTNFDHWRGRFWDLIILSIHRGRWDNEYRQLLQRRAGSLSDTGADGCPTLAADLLAVFGAAWPLDSLAQVEVITLLEEATGQPLESTILHDLGSFEPTVAVEQLLARLDRISVHS